VVQLATDVAGAPESLRIEPPVASAPKSQARSQLRTVVLLTTFMFLDTDGE
jgi:hypothetical protein